MIKNNEFDISTFSKNNKNKNNFLLQNLRNIPFAYKIKNIFEKYKFKKFINDNENFDIYHETNFIFKKFKKTKILTVHDLTWISHPNFHPKKRVIFMEKNFEKKLT